ncbi:Peptidyl-prolyl cis-trans isomerase D [Bienertia sinuspersici]
MDLMSQSKNSMSVLGIARSLKEEGNVYFKKGNFEEALEKYYAGVVLICF